MTLQTLSDTEPSVNLDYSLSIQGFKVWDYKLDSSNNLYLISENLFFTGVNENVTFSEILQYVDVDWNQVLIYCEHTGEQLTKYQWTSDHLYLDY